MHVTRAAPIVALALGILIAGAPDRSAGAGAKLWRLGVLQPGTPPEPLLEAFREGLRDLGYREGRDVVLEVRWAEGQVDRLTDLAVELATLKVDVITTLSTPAALAARRATTTIPIIFTGVGDPVGSGVVPSLARPGGNVTGVSVLATELSGKRLEILREIVPKASRLAMLWNDTNPSMVLRARETELAAATLGVTIQSVGVHTLTDFDSAFRAIETERPAALLTLVDPFTRLHRKRIVDFAAQRRLPAIYESREFVDAGGLICYGPSLTALQRRAAAYVDKILRGPSPPIFPSNSRPRSNWLSTSRPRKASASHSHQRSCCGRIRWSSDPAAPQRVSSNFALQRPGDSRCSPPAAERRRCAGAARRWLGRSGS